MALRARVESVVAKFLGSDVPTLAVGIEGASGLGPDVAADRVLGDLAQHAHKMGGSLDRGGLAEVTRSAADRLDQRELVGDNVGVVG